MREPGNGCKLVLATVLTLGFAGVEAAAGWWSGSLALLSNAGHMVTDSAALLIAAIADGSLGAGRPLWATGWFAVDPALSLLIAMLIAYSRVKLVREAFNGLMEGVPLHLSME
jgi:Co/Zn/Cd efflux system component